MNKKTSIILSGGRPDSGVRRLSPMMRRESRWFWSSISQGSKETHEAGTPLSSARARLLRDERCGDHSLAVRPGARFA